MGGRLGGGGIQSGNLFVVAPTVVQSVTYVSLGS